MATVNVNLTCDLQHPVQVQYIGGNMFSQDNAGNTINVEVFNDGEPATLGGSISANVIRADGATVAVSGALSGNRAYVIFPQACYAVPGTITVIIKNTESSTVTTIAAFVANVYQSTTDTVVDPGQIIPSVSALIAQIEAAVDSIPVDYSGLLLTLAKDYTQKPYIVGEYAWQAGVLKRCIVPITTAETYTAAHWTNAVLGDDLTALKSAFDGTNGLIGNVDYTGYPNTARIGDTARINVTQNGNILFLNNASPTAETTSIKQRLYRLNNGVEFQSTSNFNTDTLHFALKDGHRYRFLVKKISGSITAAEGAALKAFVVDSDTDQAGANSPALVDITALSGEQFADFTAGTSESINIVLRTTNGITCTNLIIAVYLLDLTEARNLMEIDASPVEDSNKLVTSGGVFDAIEDAKGKLGVVLIDYQLEDFMNGGIDGSDGSTTGSSTQVVSEYIDIESIFSAYADSPVRLTVYKYAADLSYVSGEYVGNSIDLDYINQVKTNTPTVKYLRLVYGGSTTPVRISSLGTYHVNVKQFDSVRAVDALFNFSGVTLTANRTIVVQLNDDCKNKNMIVTCESEYTGTQPTIQFSRKWHDYDDSTITARFAIYPIGTANNIMRNEWRVPAWIYPGSDVVYITITVPEGSTLTIRNMSNYYSESARNSENSFIMQAHSTSGFGAPHNTLAQFEGAARLGFKYCIAIPKVTSDGVYVCLHDDGSIQATARNDDGTSIADEYKDHPVSYFTYEQLLQFDFGIYRGDIFAGQRIPLLADFFKICARTGMHPVLSVHPSLDGHWANIKAMAKKYGVLNTLNIKGTYTTLEYPMAALLNEIESYAVVKSSGVTVANCISKINELKTANSITVPCGVEGTPTDLDSSAISSILSADLFIGVNGHGRDVSTVKTLIESGVTRITEDYNGSVGLNW